MAQIFARPTTKGVNMTEQGLDGKFVCQDCRAEFRDEGIAVAHEALLEHYTLWSPTSK